MKKLRLRVGWERYDGFYLIPTILLVTDIVNDFAVEFRFLKFFVSISIITIWDPDQPVNQEQLPF